MQKNSNLRKLVFIALLTAQGIILGLLEQAIPFPFTFAPGAKLGLANIVTLISLYTLSFKEVVLVVVMKTLMTTVLGGTFSTFLYSGMGALVSFIGMYLVKQLGEERVSMIGVSATGGICRSINGRKLDGKIVDRALIFTCDVNRRNLCRGSYWDCGKLCVNTCKITQKILRSKSRRKFVKQQTINGQIVQNRIYY